MEIKTCRLLGPVFVKNSGRFDSSSVLLWPGRCCGLERHRDTNQLFNNSFWVKGQGHHPHVCFTGFNWDNHPGYNSVIVYSSDELNVFFFISSNMDLNDKKICHKWNRMNKDVQKLLDMFDSDLELRSHRHFHRPYLLLWNGPLTAF